MSLGLVLDPTASVPEVQDSGGPPLGPLAGKVVGLRVDIYWYFWDWVADEWGRLLEADGAAIRVWRHQPLTGKEADELLAGLEQFLDDVDGVVVGLANCGSCTMWSVHDTVAALERDRATVLVATEHFEALARMLASKRGRTDVRLQLLPYPLEGRSEDEVRQIARDYYPAMLETIGATR